MVKDEFKYGPVVIILALLTLVMVYLIMAYPSERVLLLGDESGGSASISIENLQFVPETIEVNTGTTVRWTNRDNTQHKLSFGDFSSGILSRGESYTHKFSEEGTYEYSCEFHPGMRGTVVVN